MTTQIGPCPTEDSINCYWNAPTMGNAAGTSFIDIDGTQTIIDGCQPGEGLPAVDIHPETGPWAYCEPALGNDYVPTTNASTYTPGESLAATGYEVTPDVAIGAAVLVAVGFAMIRNSARG